MFDKLKRNRGFTMAELLIVVAIIGVLGGVSFIAVQTHHRSMAQLERDALAKELFVAAQNHLAMAKSEDYHGVSKFGTAGNATADGSNEDIYFFYSGSDFTSDNSSLLDLMLPFGAIDETVRAGKYIIRYQPKAAVVLDVFYWTTNDSNPRLNCSISATDYATLMDSYTGEAHKEYYSKVGGVLGWFGGEQSVASGKTLATPDIEVENAERLRVTITDNNAASDTSLKLKLIIKGQSSGAMAALDVSGDSPRITKDINGKYMIVLDDITDKDLHFAQMSDDKSNFQFLKAGDSETSLDIPFIPGENITVQAVAYSNSELTSVAYSGEVTTNSLFGEISLLSPEALYGEGSEEDESAEAPSVWTTAMIGNFRHLENLDAAISHLDENDGNGDDEKLNIVNAVQTADLDWNAFLGAFENSIRVCAMDGNAAKANCYVPVTPSHWNSGAEPVALTYDGKGVVETAEADEEPSGEGGLDEEAPEEAAKSRAYIIHSVANLAVNGVYEAADTNSLAINNGGMFGRVAGGTIRNLELIDAKVELASGNAGALAGTVDSLSETKHSTVFNVLARNTTAARDVNVAADGSVGGLIGVLGDAGTVDRCAAALTVTSNGGSAGGLIGSVSGLGATVTASYSGGHTVNGTYYDEDANPIVNVTGATYAGGLIGDTGSAQKLENCYSTCSVKGATAGGLVGNANVLVNCYATGLVLGESDNEAGPVTGALAGELKGTATVSRCRFFESINEDLPAAGKVPEGVTGIDITALDGSAGSYNAFVGATESWDDAVPYDETLTNYYGNRFNLMTAIQLGQTEKAATADKANFVATHYGDWPAPEIFVINTKQTT